MHMCASAHILVHIRVYALQLTYINPFCFCCIFGMCLEGFGQVLGQSGEFFLRCLEHPEDLGKFFEQSSEHFLEEKTRFKPLNTYRTWHQNPSNTKCFIGRIAYTFLRSSKTHTNPNMDAQSRVGSVQSTLARLGRCSGGIHRFCMTFLLPYGPLHAPRGSKKGPSKGYITGHLQKGWRICASVNQFLH